MSGSRPSCSGSAPALRHGLGRPAGAVAMMLEAAETLERVDVAAARDVMLEALLHEPDDDPLGGSVTALDLARAIQSWSPT